MQQSELTPSSYLFLGFACSTTENFSDSILIHIGIRHWWLRKGYPAESIEQKASHYSDLLAIYLQQVYISGYQLSVANSGKAVQELWFAHKTRTADRYFRHEHIYNFTLTNCVTIETACAICRQHPSNIRDILLCSRKGFVSNWNSDIMYLLQIRSVNDYAIFTVLTFVKYIDRNKKSIV